MPTPKGYPSQEKEERVKPEYVTVSKIGNSKVALDVKDQSTVSLVASDAAEAGTTTSQIAATAHLAKPGDRIRITSGTESGSEAEVESTTANAITLQQTLSTAPAPGDTFDILRPTSLTVSSSGGLSTSPGPIQFVRDAVNTTVTEDTGTPANNRPLPVKLSGVDGDVRIEAANLDLHVQLEHDTANPDSVRIGDGTETANVNASNELQVADDTARTSIASVDGKMTTHDLDTGGGTENNQGVNLRTSAGGGSVEAGTNANPLRTDPTGTTAQPVTQSIHDNLNANANLQVGDTDVANGNPVPVSDAGGSLTMDQAIHDNLNLNANLQVGDADASIANPVPSQISDGTETANVSVGGELQVRDDNTADALQNVNTSPVDVIDQLDTPLVDATTINGSAGAFVEVVASLAQKCTKIQVMDTGGVHMGIYVGAAASEVLKAQYAPGSDQTLEVEIAAGERVSLRSMETAGPTGGFISMNFIGPDFPSFNEWSTSFTGASSHWINIPDTVNNQPRDEITIVGWLNAAGGSAETLVAQRSGGADVRFSVFLDNTGGPFTELMFLVSEDGTASASGGKQWKFGNVATGGWTSFVTGFTKNEFAVFIDGLVSAGAPDVIDGTIDRLFAGSGGNITIGAIDSASPMNFLNGNLCNVAIYSKRFNADQAAEFHNGGKTMDLRKHSCWKYAVGYWPLGQGDAHPTVKDLTGNSDGAMTNMSGSNFSTSVP
jgi:hypothetical protein